jgi:hypothetical protein
MSVLNPPAKIGVGIGLGAVDLYIFNSHLPPSVDVRGAEPQNTDVDASRRSATMLCIAINGLVSVMAHDWDIFLIGGAVTAGLSWMYAHANTVHPATGTVLAPGETTGKSATDAGTYNLPDYSDDSTDDQ